jgi:hypothetical protein
MYLENIFSSDRCILVRAKQKTAKLSGYFCIMTNKSVHAKNKEFPKPLILPIV